MVNPSRQFAQPMTGHAVQNNTVDPNTGQIAQNMNGTPIQPPPPPLQSGVIADNAASSTQTTQQTMVDDSLNNTIV